MTTEPSPISCTFPENHEDLDASQNAAECNFEEVAESYWDENDPEEFNVIALGAKEKKELYEKVPYCARWHKQSSLRLTKSSLIQRSYAHKRELELLLLFLNNSFLNCMRVWTSRELIKRGRRIKYLRMDELLAYIGFELPTSLHRLNRLKDYWSSSDLLGVPFFKRVMGRDAFLHIRSSLRLYPRFEHNAASADPLGHSRQMLEHFTRNGATMAVPVGVSTLDENNVRCKGRSKARTYMKSKPVKFGIRFYAIVGWSHAYMHTLQDNGSGNKSNQTPVQRYIKLFRSLRDAVERKVDGSLISKSSTSALWCTQMAHQTKLFPTLTEGRLLVTDNFYTRHKLARQLERLSDGECKLLGTVRINNVDGINRPALKEAIANLKHARRGAWCLVQVFEKNNSANAPVEVAPNCGFIVFKDRSVVTFYSNDLAGTPATPLEGSDDHAVQCVRGLAPLQRWTGEESMRRTTLQVPSLIVAYNLFMNGVDRFDQLRSTSATVRREKRVPMSLFTFMLDASIINAHALLRAITRPGENIIDVCKLKQRIIWQLVAEHVEYKQQRAALTVVDLTESNEPNTTAECTKNGGEHILLETEGRKSVHCVLCNLMASNGRGKYTMYSCTKCQQGFHVNCFAFYHHKENLRHSRANVYNSIMSAELLLSSKLRRRRRNNLTSSLATAKVLYKK